MVPLLLTVLAVAGLLTVVPLGDGSYDCQASPISLVLDPAVERGNAHFFDDGAACNRDARRRVAVAAGVAVVGLLVTIGVALAPRLGMRPGHPLRSGEPIVPTSD